MLRFMNTAFDPLSQFESPKDRSKAQDLAFPNLNVSQGSGHFDREKNINLGGVQIGGFTFFFLAGCCFWQVVAYQAKFTLG